MPELRQLSKRTQQVEPNRRASSVIACRTRGLNLEWDRRRCPRLHPKVYLPSNVALLVAEIEDHAS
jgi:hypothetical protein